MSEKPTVIQGKRHDLTEFDEILQTGEYGKHWHDGNWYCCAPTDEDLLGNLSKHKVVEHEDGTITVSPSILINHYSGKMWHGYLERGVWREA